VQAVAPAVTEDVAVAAPVEEASEEAGEPVEEVRTLRRLEDAGRKAAASLLSAAATQAIDAAKKMAQSVGVATQSSLPGSAGKPAHGLLLWSCRRCTGLTWRTLRRPRTPLSTSVRAGISERLPARPQGVPATEAHSESQTGTPVCAATVGCVAEPLLNDGLSAHEGKALYHAALMTGLVSWRWTQKREASLIPLTTATHNWSPASGRGAVVVPLQPTTHGGEIGGFRSERARIDEKARQDDYAPPMSM
jgi:hypothetical protein